MRRDEELENGQFLNEDMKLMCIEEIQEVEIELKKQQEKVDKGNASDKVKNDVAGLNQYLNELDVFLQKLEATE